MTFLPFAAAGRASSSPPTAVIPTPPITRPIPAVRRSLWQPSAQLADQPELVRDLCQRRRGVGADGVLAQYDKRHLFSYGGEDDHYTAGSERVVFRLGDWRINLQLCYDLRFPVWCRNRDDYDLVLLVANWPARRIHHWSSLLEARAIENQAYVIGVNRVGSDPYLDYAGGSIIVSPTARPKPIMMPAKMPGLADGSTTRQTVCQRLAPRASDAALRLFGTLESESSAMVKITGITANPRARPTTMLLRWS